MSFFIAFQLNINTTIIKVVKKKLKQRYEKNQDYQEKIKPRYNIIKVTKKKMEDSYKKKLRSSRKN